MALKKQFSSSYDLYVETPNAAIKCMNLNNPIVEVLEEILVHLDLRSLITAQRVCCRWKDIVSQSSLLQTKLFFLPDRSKEQNVEWEFNPIISEIFNEQFGSSEYFTGSESKNMDIPISFQKMRNPYLSRDCYNREEASWRRMLVFQPPVKVARHIRKTDIWSNLKHFNIISHQCEGNKIPRNQPINLSGGLNARELQEILIPNPATSIAFFWPCYPGTLTIKGGLHPRVSLRIRDHPGKITKRILTLAVFEQTMCGEFDIIQSNLTSLSLYLFTDKTMPDRGMS